MWVLAPLSFLLSRWNNFEIISGKSFSGWSTFLSVSDVTNCEIKHRNDFKIISMFYFTCNTTVLAAPMLRIRVCDPKCPLSTHLWRLSSGWFPAVDRFPRGPHTDTNLYRHISLCGCHARTRSIRVTRYCIITSIVGQVGTLL